MPKEIFVQFVTFKLQPSLRNLSKEDKAYAKEELINRLNRDDMAPAHLYLAIGAATADLILWVVGSSPEDTEARIRNLLTTTLGRSLTPSYSCLGFVKESQHSSLDVIDKLMRKKERNKYLIFYPFSKTPHWYLLEKSDRDTMMAEHMKIAKTFPGIKQYLIRSYGLFEDEFVVSYETEYLQLFQEAVVALRSARVREYTMNERPIFLGMHAKPKEILDTLF
ncbi:MAG: chlorite dismutase family protein [Candidatus Micrarchaeota archaeon]|nr:chlorite dismutase family protein [Candidatus Micrarchaeota archaeon]